MKESFDVKIFKLIYFSVFTNVDFKHRNSEVIEFSSGLYDKTYLNKNGFDEF
jgi:hypothetical protein